MRSRKWYGERGFLTSMRVFMGNIHRAYLFRHLFALGSGYTKTMHMGVAAGKFLPSLESTPVLGSRAKTLRLLEP
jgi:hypothetical protein